MSTSRQICRDLVRVYDHSLEQQIVQRGSSLACRDEDLWMQVEGLLKDGDAKEKHCLGLDPLVVMEECLNAAAASAPAAMCSRRVRARGELHGLATAFEVLEQAALNLYLGPWRKEYRVIKMYSGTFSHCIAPVLSPPQVAELFGLLGYQPSPSWPEQLRLQAARVSTAALDDLLRLSCAFFFARCECRLLLAALGKHGGDARWELSVVRERLRGSSLQVAVDNARKSLETSPADGDLDLYQDEPAGGGHVEEGGGVLLPAPSCCPASNGPPTHEPHASGSVSARPDPLQTPAVAGGGPGQGDPAAPPCLRRCLHCHALHDLTCAFLSGCEAGGHLLAPPMEEGGPPSGRSTGADTPPTDRPISFHDCCDMSRPDPQLVCRRCRVFHAGSCRGGQLCQSQHGGAQLGVCGCGKRCSRSPLVLCRYCGAEFCSNCWYKNPITCSCGRTFDQSSPV